MINPQVHQAGSIELKVRALRHVTLGSFTFLATVCSSARMFTLKDYYCKALKRET